MRYLINSLFLLMISALSANCLEQNTGWSYIQSSEQAFYMFEDLDVLDALDEQGWYSDNSDVLGACSEGFKIAVLPAAKALIRG